MGEYRGSGVGERGLRSRNELNDWVGLFLALSTSRLELAE